MSYLSLFAPIETASKHDVSDSGVAQLNLDSGLETDY